MNLAGINLVLVHKFQNDASKWQQSFKIETIFSSARLYRLYKLYKKTILCSFVEYKVFLAQFSSQCTRRVVNVIFQSSDIIEQVLFGYTYNLCT